MTCAPHRWLVVWLCRRLEREGYTLVAVDGYNSTKAILAGIPAPLLVEGIRPDMLAVHGHSGKLAVGDAKSANDLLNEHTIKQLRAMLKIRDKAGRMARVYLAFPRSALSTAAKVVLRVGLKQALRVHLLPVPDLMLAEGP